MVQVSPPSSNHLMATRPRVKPTTSRSQFWHHDTLGILLLRQGSRRKKRGKKKRERKGKEKERKSQKRDNKVGKGGGNEKEERVMRVWRRYWQYDNLTALCWISFLNHKTELREHTLRTGARAFFATFPSSNFSNTSRNFWTQASSGSVDASEPSGK